MIVRASGATAERPALAEMLDRLRPGDTVMAWRLDRLGRSLRHLTGLSALLVTIIPQPAVAAPLAVLVSEHLGSQRTVQETGYGYEDEQDDFEGHDARRAWSSISSRPPKRLWDRYTD